MAALGVLTAGAIRTGHAFLADIAHNAVPTGLADGDIEIGLGNPDNSPTDGTTTTSCSTRTSSPATAAPTRISA